MSELQKHDVEYNLRCPHCSEVIPTTVFTAKKTNWVIQCPKCGKTFKAKSKGCSLFTYIVLVIILIWIGYKVMA
jgi:uncharacterized Zn finger protein